MAVICLEGGKCKSCPHYREDPEGRHGTHACFLEQDLKQNSADYIAYSQKMLNKLCHSIDFSKED